MTAFMEGKVQKKGCWMKMMKKTTFTLRQRFGATRPGGGRVVVAVGVLHFNESPKQNWVLAIFAFLVLSRVTLGYWGRKTDRRQAKRPKVSKVTSGYENIANIDIVLIWPPEGPNWPTVRGVVAAEAGTGTLHKCRFPVIPICQQSSK